MDRRSGGHGRVAVLTEPRGHLEAHVLGVFEAAIDGRRLERADWQRLGAERLVKLLLVIPGHRLSREAAAETLWPDASPGTSDSNLRKAVHYARAALGQEGPLVSASGTLWLASEALDLDLDRLQAALGSLNRGDDPSPRNGPAFDDALETVLALGSRELLPEDVYEDWLVGPRESLRSQWQRVALTAAAAAKEAGRLSDAHELVDRLLDREPADEAAHRLSIELYAREGRHHSARRQFELCRRALASLDTEPSAETVATYRRAELAAGAMVPPTPPRARLIGRQRELARVEPLLDRIAAGRSAALIIRGPAGIGKTRLLDEVRELGRGAGWQEVSWQAIESTHPFAFAPFVLHLGDLVTAADVEVLDEPRRSALATLLPALGVTPHLEFVDRTALVVALVAALVRLGRERSLLIAVDDVPWLDDASVEVLSVIASGLPDVPILAAVTYRDEEPLDASTVAMLDGLRRSGAAELCLGPLRERDVEPLVLAHLGGDSVAPDLVSWLFAQSEGNPLFCLEVARDSAERGAVRKDNDRWHTGAPVLLDAPPRAVRQLVAARIGSVDAATTRLLETAAELGPVVAFGTLSAVLPDIEGGLIAALDSAIASGLFVERAGGYAFAHPLFRVAIESKGGTARRAALHLALARVLSGAPPDGDADPAAVAERCGDSGPAAEHALAAYELGLREAGPLAVSLGFAAGLRATRLFNRGAAADFLERAAAIWLRLPPSMAGRFDATTALVNLAELRMAGDDEAAADAAFRAALDAARTPEELAFAYDRLSFLRYRHGDFATTLSLCDEALARLPRDAVGARAVIDVRYAFCLGRLGRFDECVERLEAAVRVLDAEGNLPQLSQALNHLGPFLWFTGRSADALAVLERSLGLALDLHDGRQEAMVRSHLTGILTAAGRADEARSHAERALELGRQMGDWYFVAVAEWLAAGMEDALGNLDAAVRLRRQELDSLARIGGNSHNEAFAHAHLANLARRLGDRATEIDEADRALKAAAHDPDSGHVARIEAALTAEHWSDVQEH